MSSSKDPKSSRFGIRKKLGIGSKADKSKTSLSVPSSVSVDIAVKNSQAQVTEDITAAPQIPAPTSSATEHGDRPDSNTNPGVSPEKPETGHLENALVSPTSLAPSSGKEPGLEAPKKSSFLKRLRSPPSVPKKPGRLKAGSDLDGKSDHVDRNTQDSSIAVVPTKSQQTDKEDHTVVTNPFQLANPMATYRAKVRERGSWESPSSASVVLQYPDDATVSSSLNVGQIVNSAERNAVTDENMVQEIPETERGQPIRPPRLLPYSSRMDASNQLALFCVKLRAKQTISEDLWSRAYQKLEEEQPQQMEKYKQIWTEMYADTTVVTGSSINTQRKGCKEMLEAIKTASASRDKLKREDRLKRHAEGFSKVMSVAGELLKDTMKVATGVGSGPLGPISVLLKAMDNNIEETNANRDGLEFVISQMRWYTAVATVVLREDKGATADLRYELDLTVLNFYSELLLFVIRSINCYNRNRFSDNVRMAFKIDDWEGLVDNVKAAQQSVQERLDFYLSVHDREMGRLKAIGAILKEELQPYTSTGQRFDANELNHIETCLEGTRTNFLRMIRNWAMGRDSNPIFWLGGTAGTGKSTIAKTVARELAELGYLGASFFFQTGVGSRTKASKVIPSFAAQMANPKYGIPGLREFITKAIEEDPDSLNSTGQDQWRHFIQEPLSQVADSYEDESPRIVVFVIDALDECDSERDVEDLLDILLEAQPDSELIQCRFFLTSRPEYVIRAKFERMEEGAHQGAVLHDLFPDETKQDISLYLKAKLTKIQDRRVREEFPPDWVTEEAIGKLTDRSGGLFIYAATIVRFLDNVGNPVETLANLVENETFEEVKEGLADSRAFEANKKHQDSSSATRELDRLYMMILRDKLVSVATELERIKADPERTMESTRLEYAEASDSSGGSGGSVERLDWNDFLLAFRMVVGSVVLLYDPLTVDGIAALIERPKPYIHTALRHLGSVLSISQDDRKLVQIHHLSFRDFLLDERRCPDERLRVDAEALNLKMARGALRLLVHEEDGVKKDICGLRVPGYAAVDIDPAVVQKCIPPGLQYACRYWFEHCRLAIEGSSRSILRKILGFVQRKSLLWIESLSILREIPSAVLALKGLQGLLFDIDKAPTNLLPIVEDVLRFILCNKQAMEHTPLQTYASALLFTPRQSSMRSLFESDFPNWVATNDVVPEKWDARLQSLQRKGTEFNSLSLSKSSRWIAAGSQSGSMIIWTLATGDLRRELKVAGRLDDIAFSPHVDKWIVTVGKPIGYTGFDSIFPGTRVRLWDAETGVCLSRTLLEKGAGNFRVAFSYLDSSLLAVWGDSSESPLYVLRLNGSQFELIHTLTDHLDRKGVRHWEIRGVAFARQNPAWIFSVCHYRIIGVDPGPGYASDVKFPPSRLSTWCTNTGACLMTVDLSLSQDIGFNQLLASPHNENELAFVANGGVTFYRVYASAVKDTGCLPFPSKLENSGLSTTKLVDAIFSISHSGQFITSHEDGTVRIWDIESGICQTALTPLLPALGKGRNGLLMPSEPGLLVSLQKDMVNIWDLQSFQREGGSDRGDIPTSGKIAPSFSQLSVPQASTDGSIEKLQFRYSPDLTRMLLMRKRECLHGKYGPRSQSYWTLWDTDSGYLAELEHPGDVEDDSNSVTCSVSDISFSHDSRFVVSLVHLSENGLNWFVDIWDSKTGACLRREKDSYRTHAENPWLIMKRRVLFSPDSEMFTVLSDQSNRRRLGPYKDRREWDKITKLQDFNHYLPLYVWDTGSPRVLELDWVSEAHSYDISGQQIGKFITRGCFSPGNPKKFAAASRDPSSGTFVVLVWDLSENTKPRKREPLMIIGYEMNEFTGLAFSHLGQLATVSLDMMAKIWSASSGEEEGYIDLPRLTTLDGGKKQGGIGSSQPAFVDPHGVSLAYSSDGGNVFIFQKREGSPKFDCISIWNLETNKHQQLANGMDISETLYLEKTSLRAPGLRRNVIDENGCISTAFGKLTIRPVVPSGIDGASDDITTTSSSDQTAREENEMLELAWSGLGLSQDGSWITWDGHKLLELPLEYGVPPDSLHFGCDRFGLTDDTVVIHTGLGRFCKYRFDLAELRAMLFGAGLSVRHSAL
ncbi:hypothetical protein BJ508DRAFT_332960 [Ascobolus immersus RN42]|uniref:NACHT domain-containing protein n=1 Tax=Ascobolus immersus RN42 TaxID=1160509 RepID=A0A3N4HNM3_ASCIM|nr:hypothetical protein BJ508DRAFT_332960 [Ascobolus immersus RN42]